MKSVWILFSVANDYNQPDKAFEKLWWHKPTHDDLKEFGFDLKESECLRRPNYGGMTELLCVDDEKWNKTIATMKAELERRKEMLSTKSVVANEK